MHNLGRTRSSQQPNHLLLTPDTFVRAPLPGMKKCTAIVHVGPALGAAFTQYTAEFESGGELGGTDAQRFIYVLEGAVTVESEGQSSRTGRARLRLFSRRRGAPNRRHETEPRRGDRKAVYRPLDPAAPLAQLYPAKMR